MLGRFRWLLEESSDISDFFPNDVLLIGVDDPEKKVNGMILKKKVNGMILKKKANGIRGIK